MSDTNINPDALESFAYGTLRGGTFQPHQAEGIVNMFTMRKTLCADPPGAGKTVQAAGLLACLADRGELTTQRPALVLTSSKHLARQTAAELSRHLVGVLVIDLANDRRTASRRACETITQRSSQVYVTTYDQFRTHPEVFDGVTLSALLLDEASALKGGRVTYRAVHALSAGVPRIHAFTATPYTNDPIETYHLVSCLHLPGTPPRAEFDRRFVRFAAYGDNQKAVGWTEAVDDFRAFLGGHYFRREDACAELNLPQCERTYDYVPLSVTRARQMAATERHTNHLYRYKEQERIARGDADYSAGAERAAKRLWDLLRDDPDLKVLVVGESLKELEALEMYLKGFGLSFMTLTGQSKQSQRGATIEAFRDGADCRVLIGSTVLQEGLNLQFCRVLISLGVPDNSAGLEQRQGRIVRPGSPFPTVRHEVILTDTRFDRQAVARVDRKAAEAAKLL